MKRKKFKKYRPEFRNQAVELVAELGSITAVSEKLGVPHVTLHTWVTKSEQPKEAEISNAKESPEEELRRLRKENGELKKANHILKAAAAFFSQDHLK